MAFFKRIATYLLMLVLLAFPFVVYFKAQALTDWWQLHNYVPPTAISTLAAQDTMTDKARHFFYLNHPDLESDPSQFQKDCTQSEQTIVLGCYKSSETGIFIYDVTDPRLKGVQQVTAAHEMLHAAYNRLSQSEKNTIDNELQDYYNNDLHDQRVIDTMDAYKQTEPGELVNEMHSIFGTEIANLPAPLENYYKQYFVNRQTVTTFANDYEQEFTTREDLLKSDAAQLDSLKIQIDSDEASLQAQGAKLDSDRARLNSLRSSGNYSGYNAGVSAFNSEVDAYNSLAAQIRAEISKYNQLVIDYNNTAKEIASLQKALDSRQPQSTQ